MADAVQSAQRFAIDHGYPIVYLNDSGGARVQDAVTSLAWYAELGKRHEPLSGLCPQVSIILGKCAGGAVYAPINTDVVVATEEAYMFVTGPDVIKSVTGEDVSLDELGSVGWELITAKWEEYSYGGRTHNQARCILKRRVIQRDIFADPEDPGDEFASTLKALRNS